LLAALALALAGAPLTAPITGVPDAVAHQQTIAISTVSINPRTGMVEIVHQVPLHDAEHALRLKGVSNPDILGDEKSREAFAAYVTKRFVLEIDGVAVQPAYLGSEASAGSLFVYQELPAPKADKAMLRFNSQILTDLWARQENRVNIGGGTRPETFIFHDGDSAREALLMP
jgi:hypothetical protein